MDIARPEFKLQKRRRQIVLFGVTVESLDFSERSRIRNQEIGFIFQSFNLIGDLTLYENVELPHTYRQRMAAPDGKKRVMEALERVGMAHRIRHYPSQLSGGQQQHVASPARWAANLPSCWRTSLQEISTRATAKR
jgi:putative ABC transport system ATP-binding protein